MGRKVLVLDIDGTLTNSKREITPATRQALIGIQQLGHIVVLASGRPTGGLRMITGQIGLDRLGGYMISYNGACVTNAATGEAVFRSALPRDAAAWMHAYALRHDMGMCTYIGNDLLCGTRPDPYIDRETQANEFRFCRVNAFDAEQDYYKILLTAEPSKAIGHEEYLAQRFEGRMSIFRSEPFFIEVMAQGVSKANAIAALIKRIGVEREDVIACGDGLNDLSIIRYAGVGVAMGNAQPEVKEAADTITLTNDEDGLIPVIRRYILEA